MPNIISQLEAKKITKDENNNIVDETIESIPIGVYSDNVVISDTNTNKKFSLTQLYNYLKSFFSQTMFSWYGESLPAGNNSIVSFYQITEDSNSITNA